MKSNMKKILLTIVALLCIMGSLAKGKEVVWEKPTTEYGNVYGDGYFNIAMDVNRVEMKETETTVSVTVNWRNDYDSFKFQFASGTYLLAEGKKYALSLSPSMKSNTLVLRGSGWKWNTMLRLLSALVLTNLSSSMPSADIKAYLLPLASKEVPLAN